MRDEAWETTADATAHRIARRIRPFQPAHYYVRHCNVTSIPPLIRTIRRAIVAGCTGRNPNIFYEIGIAHTVGVPVVLFTKASDDVPFDVMHLRRIDYDYTPRGTRAFEAALEETLRTA